MQSFGDTCCQVEGFLPEATETSLGEKEYDLVCIDEFRSQFSATRLDITGNHVFQFDSWKTKLHYEEIVDPTLYCIHLPGRIQGDSSSSSATSHPHLPSTEALDQGKNPTFCLTQFCHVFKVPLVNGAVPEKCAEGPSCRGKLHPELNANGKLDKKSNSLSWAELKKRHVVQRLASVLNTTTTTLTDIVDLVKWEG